MSAICGIMSLNHKEIDTERTVALFENLKGNYDRRLSWSNDIAFLGAHILEITQESVGEVLPYYDVATGIAITADAIIDNRNELIARMNLITKDVLISDSQLILEAYIKWGNRCVEYLLGDFAFCIYDSKQDKLFCARDQLGKRLFYYYQDEEVFAFATNMTALLKSLKKKCKLNDAWIADFLSFEGPMHDLDPQQTVFQGITQLLPATILTVESEKIGLEQYWDPFRNRTKIIGKAHEYEEGLKQVTTQAVSNCIRTKKAVGISLSGGIDSCAVAGIAAKQLEKSNRVLMAYSAIPFLQYKDQLKGFRVANESEYIEAIKSYVGNIQHTYMGSENKNSVTDIEQNLECLEHPYKFIENIFWLNEIHQIAAHDNCGVLLNGQYGNAAFSFGNIMTHLITLHRKRKYITLLDEANKYSRIMDLKSSIVLKAFLKSVLPSEVLSLLGKNTGTEDISIVNKKLAIKTGVDVRLKECEIGKYSNSNKDVEELFQATVNQRVFAHIGGIKAKMSLKNDLIIRDPTADVSLIEYCFRVPYTQYVNDGKERDLVRRTMVGILPDKIRLNYNIRGLQSADWVQRIAPTIKDIKDEVCELLKDEKFRYYVDVDEVENLINSVDEHRTIPIHPKLRWLIICIIVGRFLKKYNEVY